MGCENRKKTKESLDVVLDEAKSHSDDVLDTFVYESRKDKVKRFIDERYEGSRTDQAVDVLWDAAFEGLEWGSKPLKYILQKMTGGEITPEMLEASWFRITQFQKDVSEMMRNVKIERANFAEDAGALKKWLSSFSKEDSRSLVQALNGDVEPSTLKGGLLAETYEKIRKVIDTNADELVRLGVLDSKNKIEHYLKRYYTKYIEDTKNGGSAAFSKFYKRKDLDYEARLALGMIEDASFVISKTLLDQKMLIQKARTLKLIADKFGLDVEKEGYVRISDETAPSGTVKKWGALAGKWVPKEVKRELVHAQVLSDELATFEKIIYPIVDFLKVTLTVKNPVTHLFNIGSNINLSGIRGDLVNVGRLLYMRHKNRANFDALVKKANKHGLNSQLDDLEQFHIVLAPDGKKVNIVKTFFKNMFMTADSKAGKGIRHLYDWEDKIFKLAAFDRNLKKGMDEAAAYKEAVGGYVDYNKPRPGAVAVLDKSGLMPFITYQFHSTPAVAKVMLRNPVKAAIFGGGAMYLKMSAWQNDDEESFLPDWARDKFNLWGVKEWYEVADGWYLNTGRMIPGTKFEFELGGFWKGILNIVGGKTPLGYDIDGKYDDAWDKVYKRGLALAENYTPPLLTGRYGQRLAHIGLGELGLVEPKKNYYKENMTVKELALRALGVRKFNKQSEVNKSLRSFVSEWGAGKISKETMESKINAVIKAAKEEGLMVDHRKLRTALKRARGRIRNKKQ